MVSQRIAHRSRGLVARPSMIALGSLAVMGLLGWLLFEMSRPSRPQENGGDLVLYCAAGLLRPVEEICAQYDREYGIRVQIEADGSGKLLSKIRITPDRGDLFLAGEESYLRDGRAAGLVAEILPVARQHVVIGVAGGNPHKIATLADLMSDAVRVALPNPELTAIGKTAQQALAKTGEWDALLKRTRQATANVSLVGTVTEAAQAVKVGAADAALVWDATARQFGLEAVEVPALQSQATELASLGVLARTERAAAALRFARYLTACDKGQRAFARHHLQPLEDADVWEDRPSLRLMAGAMLKPGIDQSVQEFGEREGVTIDTIYAGCGIHVAQMKAMKAAPAASHFPDAYFACDVSFMRQVESWFEAARVLSRNDMVLAVAKGNPQRVRTIADLVRPELRIGLAHPVNSALGALTDDLLKKLSLHAKVYAADRRHPVVHADAGHMLVNQLRAGALDALIVYRSNVLSNPENAEKYLQIVEMNLPEAIAIQPYAVAKDSEHRHLMRRLMEKLVSSETERRFREAGFQWIAEGTPR